MVTHWLYKTDPDLNQFGFVYCITNLKTNKSYIGCKQYYNYRKRKKKKESDWRSYTGSSKQLNEDIKTFGKKNFRFEIIAEFINKRSLKYYECYYQMKHDVLTATLEDDSPAYYNNYIGGKFYRPVQDGDKSWQN